MAVAFQSIGQSPGVASTICQITKPSGVAVGDLLIAVCVWNGQQLSFNAPSGWTPLEETFGGEACHLKSWWKIATATEVAASTFDFQGDSSVSNIGLMARFTGHHPTSPIGPIVEHSSSTTGSNTTGPTSTSLGQMLVGMAASANDNVWTLSAGANTANATERADINTIAGSDSSITMWTWTIATVGATGSLGYSRGESTLDMCFQGFLINPAPSTSSVTKGLQYAVKLTPAALTKGTIYDVKAPVAVNKSLQYTIKYTPSAVSKALKYTVTIINSITKGLIYRVVTPTTLNKTLSYAVKASPSVQKTLQYTITITPSALTKALQYALATLIAIQKSVQYAIKYTPSPITKDTQYAVKTEQALAKGLQYTVTTTPATIEKDLKYDVKIPVGLSKSLQYAVTVAGNLINKSLAYSILNAANIISLGLQYAIKTTQSISLTLIYEVTVPTGITKPLQYAVTSPYVLSKQLTYRIVQYSTENIIKTLTYMIRVVQSLTLELKYTVKPSASIQKSLQYVVASQKAITLSCRYVIRQYPYSPKTDEIYTEMVSPYNSVASPYTRWH